MKTYLLHYKRRHRTGTYTTDVRAISEAAAKEALVEFERGRGYSGIRFLDEPEEVVDDGK